MHSGCISSGFPLFFIPLVATRPTELVESKLNKNVSNATLLYTCGIIYDELLSTRVECNELVSSVFLHLNAGWREVFRGRIL